MREWPARRWLVAAGVAVATVVVIGVPTAMVPTPLFGREIPPTAWAWPVLVATAVLSGLLTATYVAAPADGVPGDEREVAVRTGWAGGLLTFFAVGCPVCNKVVLLALGTTGAVRWFAPVQPYLGLVALGLLAYALRRRLAGERACPVPTPSGVG